jgi:hypothetical protein
MKKNLLSLLVCVSATIFVSSGCNKEPGTAETHPPTEVETTQNMEVGKVPDSQ